jgi:hypothetical protein
MSLWSACLGSYNVTMARSLTAMAPEGGDGNPGSVFCCCRMADQRDRPPRDQRSGQCWVRTYCYCFAIVAFASQVVTSATVGTRPAQTTFPLMTRPGVARILYFRISAKSVTFSTSASADRFLIA